MQVVVGRRAVGRHVARTNTLRRRALISKENLTGLERVNAAWVDLDDV